MVKKSLMIGTAVALFLGLFFGRDAFSLVSTSVDGIQQSVKDSVPLELRLKQARNAIGDLDPEIERNMHLIAKEKIEVVRLEKQVGSCDDCLAQDEIDLQYLTDRLQEGSSQFDIAGRIYTISQVKTDLKNRFEHFKSSKAKTEKLHKVLIARRNSLQAARDKLEAMLAAKRQLEIDVENLEARMKMIEVAKTTSEFNFDDSQLSQTRQLLEDISTRLDVTEELLNTNLDLHDRIPLGTLEADGSIDIVEQVTTYFNPEIELVADRSIH